MPSKKGKQALNVADLQSQKSRVFWEKGMPVHRMVILSINKTSIVNVNIKFTERVFLNEVSYIALQSFLFTIFQEIILLQRSISSVSVSN